MNIIPFFDYPNLFAERKKEYLDTIEDVLSRGAYIMQKDLLEFEEELSSYLNVKHAIGVADGTMALLLSLKSIDLNDGDEIILPSHTFIASAAAIHHAGAKPVLVECGKDHLIDAKSIINSITSKTKGIMPVQLNGRVSNMELIQDIAKKYDLFILEDSCQASGAKFDNQYAGTFGVAGTFSFFPAKTLGCFGDGGAVITDDDEIVNSIKILRDHGRNPKNGKAIEYGFNARLDNIQAAILKTKFKYYDLDIKRRREIASIYDEKLKVLGSLHLPPAPNSDSRNFDIFQNYEIEADNREKLRDFLSKSGIGTIIQWGGYAIHQFKELGFSTDLNFTEEITRRFMMLPIYPILKDEQIIYISDKIIEFYDTYKK